MKICRTILPLAMMLSVAAAGAAGSENPDLAGHSRAVFFVH